MGADIIPPVVTGRVTSKNFAFTYGTVYVRAKMPKGDWLYPGNSCYDIPLILPLNVEVDNTNS